MGRQKKDPKKRVSIMVPVRLTIGEYKKLKKLVKDQGDVYTTRTVRRLIQVAIGKSE